MSKIKTKTLSLTLLDKVYPVEVALHLENTIVEELKKVQEQLQFFREDFPNLSDADYLSMYIIWRAGLWADESSQQVNALRSLVEKIRHWRGQIETQEKS